MSFLKNLLSLTTGAFRNDRSGSVAIIFGLIALVMLDVMGAAIDFANAYRVHSMLGAHADSAALSAVAGGSPSYLEAAAMTSDGELTDAETAVVANFRAQITRSMTV